MSQQIKSLVKNLKEKYGTERTALLNFLNDINEIEGYLSEEALIEVAKTFDLSGAEVFGTASFYHFFSFKPRGKYVIRLCKTIVCDMKGKNNILEQIKKCLGINVGETTSDGLFTLELTNCLGQCDKAPAMLINNDVYTNLTSEKVREIIKSYKQKNKNYGKNN